VNPSRCGKTTKMILYNVTINVEDIAAEEWLEWMQQTHIPEVISTGLFTGYRMFRILSTQPDETGVTYSIQYYLKNIDDYNLYQATFAPELQRQHMDLFEGKVVAFRTLLEEVLA
jgi:hypothetical protein